MHIRGLMTAYRRGRTAVAVGAVAFGRRVWYVTLYEAHYIGNITRIRMAKGESGRIVIEVDPALKRRLYSALALENRTLKEWFIDLAQRYLSERSSSPSSEKNTRSKS